MRYPRERSARRLTRDVPFLSSFAKLSFEATQIAQVDTINDSMAARQNETIIPFYFGNDQQRLFGCYHGMAASDSDCGFVLCYPFGYEYFRAHAAYRQLAKRLSANGFPVLRFDFYGCGDSSGEFQDARLGDWTGNVHSAIDELKRRSGRTSICVLGSRLSGAISLMAIAARDDVHRDRLVCRHFRHLPH